MQPVAAACPTPPHLACREDVGMQQVNVVVLGVHLSQSVDEVGPGSSHIRKLQREEMRGRREFQGRMAGCQPGNCGRKGPTRSRDWKLQLLVWSPRASSNDSACRSQGDTRSLIDVVEQGEEGAWKTGRIRGVEVKSTHAPLIDVKDRGKKGRGSQGGTRFFDGRRGQGKEGAWKEGEGNAT
eukprot:194124-Chlamydomonas_euryale.AAC.2